MRAVRIGAMGWFLATEAAWAGNVALVHQGRLLDAAGQPLPDGSPLTVALYGGPTDPTPLWSDQYSDSSGGYYAAVLTGTGDGTVDLDDVLATDPTLWVEVRVGAVTFGPREPLRHVPLAAHAERAGGAALGTATVGGSCAREGALVWDSADDALRVCDGSTWKNIGAGSGTPTITSVSPSSGVPGTVVTVTGTGFGASGATLTVGGVVTPVNAQTATSLTFTLGLAHPAVPSNVVVDQGASGSATAPNAVARTERSAVFGYSSATQTWTVPPGVTQFDVYLWGAGGASGGSTGAFSAGGDGGGGAGVTARFAANPGDVFAINTGESLGMTSSNYGAFSVGGGASGGGRNAQRYGGRGGGRTTLTKDSQLYAVAGGGGGGNSVYEAGEIKQTGGPGGGLTGLPGSGSGTPPTGGTQVGGGVVGSMSPGGGGNPPEAGASGVGGRGRGWNNIDVGYGAPGGGGGGFFGGGGGEGGARYTNAQSGAGGSSYVNPAALSSFLYAGSGRIGGNASSPWRSNAGDGGLGTTSADGQGGNHGRVVIVY
jgi:hypothetical protein